MDFFHDVNSGQRTNIDAGRGGIAEKLSLLVLLLFLLPLVFVKRKKKYSSNINLDGLKRISGKPRLAGINWNKKPLYNDRNQSRIQKDA